MNTNFFQGVFENLKLHKEKYCGIILQKHVRDLPERFGPWQTVYSRFRLWSQDDTFKDLFERLSSDADMQDLSIDSTSCKAHQHAAGAKKGLKMHKPIKI